MAVGEIFGAVLQAGFDMLGTLGTLGSLGADIASQKKARRGAAIRLVFLLPVTVFFACLVIFILHKPTIDSGDIVLELICLAACLGALCGCYLAMRVLARTTEPVPPEA